MSKTLDHNDRQPRGAFARNLGMLSITLLALSMVAASATAQVSSLHRAGQETDRYLSLQSVSLTWQAPIPPNKVKLHDIITVVVDEKSLFQAKAILDREKKGSVGAILEAIPIIRDFNLKPSPQTAGDPELRASFDSILEADANNKTSERIAFEISVTVVEIRPNGNLVVEGHRQITNNEENWEQSLTGIIQPDKVNEGRVARAGDFAELRIFKRERGEVRDGYRRGWVLRFLDRIQTF